MDLNLINKKSLKLFLEIAQKKENYPVLAEILNDNNENDDLSAKLNNNPDLVVFIRDFTEAINILSGKTGYQDPFDEQRKGISANVRAKIENFVFQSPFTKNRKEKLWYLLENIYIWKSNLINQYLLKGSGFQNYLYPGYTDFILQEFIPLPASLLGRWISMDVPIRKPVDKFNSEILGRIENSLVREFIKRSFYIDSAGKRYVLRTKMGNEHRKILKSILRSIGYQNNSKTKYKDYLDYLIETGVLELKVLYAAYDSYRRCNYYKVRI